MKQSRGKKVQRNMLPSKHLPSKDQNECFLMCLFPPAPFLPFPTTANRKTFHYKNIEEYLPSKTRLTEIHDLCTMHLMTPISLASLNWFISTNVTRVTPDLKINYLLSIRLSSSFLRLSLPPSFCISISFYLCFAQFFFEFSVSPCCTWEGQISGIHTIQVTLK